MAAPALAVDWTLGRDEAFESSSPEWLLRGTGAGVREGALRTSGETHATCTAEFEAPAVRVEYEARFEKPDDSGRIGDLSCYIGEVFFSVGGQNNSTTFIRAGQVSSDELGARLKLGQTYHVVAEVNGRVATLSLDGKPLGQLLLLKEPRDKKVTLYTWTGAAAFDRVRIFTKSETDPVPEGLLSAERFGRQTPQTLKHLRDWPRPAFAAGKPASVARERVALSVDYGPHARPGMNWPITTGVPIVRDVLFDPEQARVIDEQGREVPSQRTVTATWSEGGSVRWLLLDFVLPVAAQPPKLFLEYGADVKAAPVTAPVAVSQDDSAITVTPGSAQFVVSRKSGGVIESASLDANGDVRFSPDEKVLAAAEAYYTTRQGQRYWTQGDEELDVKVELAGPIRTVVRSRGWYKNEAGRRACYFVRRLHFYRGLPWARLLTTFVFTVDTNAYTFTDIGVRFPMAGHDGKTYTVGDGSAQGAVEWTGAADDTAVALAAGKHRGVVTLGTHRSEAGDLPGWIDARAPGGRGLTLACYEMARQWPAALEAGRDAVTFHAFSNAAGLDLDLTLRGLKAIWGEKAYELFEASRAAYPSIAERNANGCGLAKTHELLLVLHDGKSPAADAARTFQDPVLVASDPAHNCKTGVVGPGEYHPYDPQHFAREERVIEQERDRFLKVVDRFEPVYGWWDYGMGIPHANIDENNENPVLAYDGYRRDYDVGYGTTLSPWMMYLRSGQRPWLMYAIRNARGVTDGHLQHWTHSAYNKHVGWFAQDHGTWPWDTYLAGWGFNVFTPSMLLDYYTTGDERAMDAHTLVMDEFCLSGKPYYVASLGLWTGNLAAAYRATWEPKYLQKFEEHQRDLLKCICKLCGGVKPNPDTRDANHDAHGTIHRDGWVEYGITEARQMDGFNTELEKVLVLEGQRRVETHAATPYSMMSYTRLAAFRATGDSRIAREAADMLHEYTTPPNQSFTTFCGIAQARHLPVLMRLALTPNLENVTPPVYRKYPSPVLVRHVSGTPTKVQVLVAQNLKGLAETGVTATAGGGAPPGPSWLSYDPILGRVSLNIPADAPASVCGLNFSGGRVLHVIHEADTPVMIGIPSGFCTGEGGAVMAPLYFLVPKGTRHFRIRNSLPERPLTITRPDGQKIQAAQEWQTIEPPSDPSGAWCIEAGTQGAYNFQAIKLYDIPAVVALSLRSLFSMEHPVMSAPDFVSPLSDGPFVDGALSGGRALRLRGADALRIPLGEKTGASSRQRFNASRGTIEFFFMLNTDPVFAGVHSLPFALPVDPSVKVRGWTPNWLSFYKNAVLFMTPEGQQECGEGSRLGPWDTRVGMTSIEPGKWHHIAILWDTDKSFPGRGDAVRKSQVRVFLDGKFRSNGPWVDDPSNFNNPYAAPLPGRFIEMISEGRDIAIDELRVSDTERLPWTGVHKETAYPIPTRAYEPDEYTLLLMHFDGDAHGLGRNGDFEAEHTAVSLSK